MKAVTSIGIGFLYNCATLSTIDFTGMKAVTSIGDWFLDGCTTLSTVHLTSMQAVTLAGRLPSNVHIVVDSGIEEVDA